MSLVRITNAILGDENLVLTVSSYDEENDVFVGNPTILNKNGVAQRIYVKLNDEETDKLTNSINVLKNAIKSISE